MNRTSKLAVFLLLAALMCSMPIVAQTNQGFEWGFTVDDVFHFHMYLEGDGLFIDDEIYFEFNATLPAIPDSMDNWTDVPWGLISPPPPPGPVINTYYANGTELGIEVLAFAAVYNMFLPLGNWALLSTLAQDTLALENLTLDPEDPYFWGYSWEDADWVVNGDSPTIYSNYTLYVHVDYLKVDGFLSHYSVDSYNITTKEKTGTVTLDRLGIEQYMETTVPTLNHPADIEYVQGQTGNIITWSPSDQYPASYQILLDGSILRSGTWNSTAENIVEVVDGHAVGEYNYTIVVADVRGNTAVDEVTVTVLPPPFDPLIAVIAIAAAGVVLMIVAVAIRRR
ncbi:MAG: hypothetical protein ACE5H4_12075 [Candidatus Thorarchaeota archaeon]